MAGEEKGWVQKKFVLGNHIRLVNVSAPINQSIKSYSKANHLSRSYERKNYRIITMI